jgi:hypothetical protein
VGARDVTGVAYELDAASPETSAATGTDMVSIVGMGGVAPGAMLGREIYFVATGYPYLATTIGLSQFWLEGTLHRLGELSALPPGWDGHRAPPVSPGILQMAGIYLRYWASFVRIPPSVVPTAAGGVAFEWHRTGVDLEIEFHDTGEITVFGEEEATGYDFEGPLQLLLPDVTRLLVGFV